MCDSESLFFRLLRLLYSFIILLGILNLFKRILNIHITQNIRQITESIITLLIDKFINNRIHDDAFATSTSTATATAVSVSDATDITINDNLFIKSLCELLINNINIQIKNINNLYNYKIPINNTLINSDNSSLIIIPNTIELKKYSAGFVYNNYQNTLKHTYSFYIKRNKSLIIDIENIPSTDKPSDTQSVPQIALKLGMNVMRGNDWKIDCLEDSYLGNFGEIIEIKNITITVLWNSTNIRGKYIYDIINNIQEIMIIDNNISGLIYSKGAPGLNLSQKNIPWNIYGCKLLGNGNINMFISCDEKKLLSYQSKQKIAADVWTNVTIVQDLNVSKIYINGCLDNSITLEDHMLTPGEYISYQSYHCFLY